MSEIMIAKSSTPIDQKHFDGQLKLKGLEDRDGNGSITSEEIDAKRIKGGMESLSEQCVDGMISERDVRFLDARHKFGDGHKIRKGSRIVWNASADIEEATYFIEKAFRKKNPKARHAIKAMEQLNKIFTKLYKATNPEFIGPCRETEFRQLKAAVFGLSQAMRQLNGLKMQFTGEQVDKVHDSKPRIFGFQYKIAKEFEKTAKNLPALVHNQFNMTFPSLHYSYSHEDSAITLNIGRNPSIHTV